MSDACTGLNHVVCDGKTHNPFNITDPCDCHCHTGQLAFDLDPHTHARTSDPETSHIAAEVLSDKTTMMRRLLGAFVDHPRTAEEAAKICGYTAEDGPWRRVSDLTNAGLIYPTGQIRSGSSNRPQAVHAITLEGEEVLAGHRPWPAASRQPRPKSVQLAGNPKAEDRVWQAMNDIVRWYLNSDAGKDNYIEIRDAFLADLDTIVRGEP